jgi:hypothetical protein
MRDLQGTASKDKKRSARSTVGGDTVTGASATFLAVLVPSRAPAPSLRDGGPRRSSAGGHVSNRYASSAELKHLRHQPGSSTAWRAGANPPSVGSTTEARRRSTSRRHLGNQALRFSGSTRARAHRRTRCLPPRPLAPLDCPLGPPWWCCPARARRAVELPNKARRRLQPPRRRRPTLPGLWWSRSSSTSCPLGSSKSVRPRCLPRAASPDFVVRPPPKARSPSVTR